MANRQSKGGPETPFARMVYRESDLRASDAIRSGAFAFVAQAYQLRDLDGLTRSEAAHILGVTRGNPESPGITSTRGTQATDAPGAG